MPPLEARRTLGGGGISRNEGFARQVLLTVLSLQFVVSHLCRLGDKKFLRLQCWSCAHARSILAATERTISRAFHLRRAREAASRGGLTLFQSASCEREVPFVADVVSALPIPSPRSVPRARWRGPEMTPFITGLERSENVGHCA